MSSEAFERAAAEALGEPISSRVDVRWPEPRMNFLVAYDIADAKRLRDVAKTLERNARRVQKSVFVFTGTRRELEGVIRELVKLIEPAEDRIQAWPIRTSSKALRIDVGNALPDTAVTLIIASEECTLIEAVDDDANQLHDDPPLCVD